MKEQKSGRVARVLAIVLGVVFLALGGLLGIGGIALMGEEPVQENVAAFDTVNGGEETAFTRIALLTESFAVSGEDEEYYVSFNEAGEMVLICMKREDFGKYQKIYEYTYSEETEEAPEAMEFQGYPMEIDQDLKELAITFVNEVFGESGITVTEDNFSDYMGNYYLDATMMRNADGSSSLILFALALFPTALGILLLVLAQRVKKTERMRAEQERRAYGANAFGQNDAYTQAVAGNGAAMGAAEGGSPYDAKGATRSFENGETKGNPVMGLLGAILGALAGAVIWVAAYQFGYLVGIAGYVSVMLGLMLYERFSGKPGKGGVIACVVISMLLLFFANMLGCSMVLVREVNKEYPNSMNLLYALSNFGALMERFDMWASFWQDLAVGLLLALVAGIGPRFRKFRRIRKGA